MKNVMEWACLKLGYKPIKASHASVQLVMAAISMYKENKQRGKIGIEAKNRFIKELLRNEDIREGKCL